MTPVRTGVSLLLVGLICLVVVVLRAERKRLEARTQTHLTALIEHRRCAWSMQIEIARLRAPQQIRDRVERMELRVRAAFNDTVSTRRHQKRFAQNGR